MANNDIIKCCACPKSNTKAYPEEEVASTTDEELSIIANCIRVLAVEGIEKAKSGHPGMPLGAADLMVVLWHKYLRFNPEHPEWIDRDRFILSAGHGSMLLYTLLHIYGYDLPLEELRKFRQLDSRTPGHPEYGVTAGVEVSTGPLGQGMGNAVGMAIGYEMLRATLSKNGTSPLNHKTYVLAGDGDMMEGVSYEAASLAGHLGLSNLVVLYDANSITIEGSTDLSFSENVEQRYKAMNWEVYTLDGHDFAAIDKVLQKASGSNEKPVLVIAKTTIAKGSISFEGSHKSHGSPFGDDEIIKIKKKMGFPEQECFCVFDEVKKHARMRVEELKKEYIEWTTSFAGHLKSNPDIKEKYDEYQKEPSVNAQELLSLPLPEGKQATRSISGFAMQHIAKKVASFVGGSADLGGSTSTILKGLPYFTKADRAGRNIQFGIREHVMGSLMNGLALYGNYLPFGSTFLVFSDYMRPAIRMSALMKLHVVYVFTHDSFNVGEDGPTHQPIEHVASLRLIPNLDVIRPADTQETIVGWAHAVNNSGNPTALILTRQALPVIDRKKYASAELLIKGGYVISPEKNTQKLSLILIATGSEVSLALGVQEKLQDDGVSVRVVSMPCVELFERQESNYRDTVLSSSVRTIVIEAGSTQGWYKYAYAGGMVIGLDTFGISAPATTLAEKFGFTVNQLYALIRK